MCPRHELGREGQGWDPQAPHRKADVRAEAREKAAAPKAARRRRSGGAGGGVRLGPLAWASILYAVVVAIAFHAVILGGLTFVSPDTTAPLGFVRVGEESLWRHGVYPLWNPYVFTGMPSFASGAYNPLIYPPDWPVALVQKLLPLPDVSWMLLYYFLAGLGTFVLARHWGASTSAAIVGGLAFMITPNIMANGAHGHGSQLVNEGYLPWMLWLTSRLWQKARPADAAFLALLVGFQLLRGHVQIAYYAWLMIGLLSAVRVRPPGLAPGRRPRRGAARRAARAGDGPGLRAVGVLLAAHPRVRAILHPRPGRGRRRGLRLRHRLVVQPGRDAHLPRARGARLRRADVLGHDALHRLPQLHGPGRPRAGVPRRRGGQAPVPRRLPAVLAAFALLVSFGKHSGSTTSCSTPCRTSTASACRS